MSKILVTGGQGFIGKYLMRTMEEEGHHVFAPGKADLDVTLPTDFNRFSGLGFDAVVHLAALLMINKHMPKEYFMVNSLGTFNALEFCRKEKIQTFIYTMTHSDTNGYVTEGLRPYDPQNFRTGSWDNNSIPFISSKIAAADMVESYNRMGVLHGAILRLANIRGYGSADTKYDCVFHQFIQKALKGEDIEIWGNPPETRRDMIYVKDTTAAIMKFVEAKRCKGFFNIGTGIGMTIEQEATAIISIFSPWSVPTEELPMGVFETLKYKKSKIIYRPDIPEVRKVTCVFDIKKTVSTVDWTPQYSYIEGLQDYKREAGL